MLFRKLKRPFYQWIVGATCAFTPVLLLAAGVRLSAQLPQPRPLDPSPWNGSWKLKRRRSSPVASQRGVPQVYRFMLGPGPSPSVLIQWEIPELGEVVKGKTDGDP